MKNENLKTPLIAIGGIVLEDIPKLKKIGVFGIAFSSLFFNSQNKKALVNFIHKI